MYVRRFKLASRVFAVFCGVFTFISRQHTDARFWYRISIRPSVCLSNAGIMSGYSIFKL